MDFLDIILEVCDELLFSNLCFCEVVLWFVFVFRGLGESLEDCMKSVDVVK